MSGEKNFLQECISDGDKSHLGMFHGRLTKVNMDIEAEKEMEKELTVSSINFSQCKFSTLEPLIEDSQNNYRTLRPKCILSFDTRTLFFCISKEQQPPYNLGRSG